MFFKTVSGSIYICVLLTVAGIACNISSGFAALPDTALVPSVRWIMEWPAPGEKPKLNFRDRFNAVMFGKKSPVLSRPVAVSATSPDDFWCLDQAAGKLFNVEKKVGEIPHFLQKTSAVFPSLVGVCKSGDGVLLFTDSQEGGIYRMDPRRKTVSPWVAGQRFSQPVGIAQSPVDGLTWVVETGRHRICLLDRDGRLADSIGQRGTGPGEFNYPTSLWIDRQGRAYVVDALNFRIQVFDHAGRLISVFGKQGDCSGTFARPKGIAVDSHGNIFIVDALFHAVQVFSLKGEFLFTVGKQGHATGEFWMPSGIFIDDLDNIYVADSYNSRIQVFRLSFGS